MAIKTKKSINTILTKLKMHSPSTKLFGLFLTLTGSTWLLSWHLTSLTSNLISNNELITKHQLLLYSPWWKSFNGFYGPYYLLLHLTHTLDRSVYGFRLASLIVGVLSVAAVYWTVSAWHGFKIGLLAALICLTSFGVLASSREASPLISQILIAAFLLMSVSLINQNTTKTSLSFFILVLIVSIYEPGGIWLALVALALSHKAFIGAYKSQPRYFKIALPISSLLLVLPLSYQLIRHYSGDQLYNLLGYGLGTKSVNTIWHSFFLNFIHIPSDLFFRSENLGLNLSLGHLPLIPIAFSILFVLGLYSYIARFNNWRWRSVVVFLASIWLLASFGVFSSLAMLPLVAVTAGTGLAFILKEWYIVFPRNPIARFAGLLIMFAVVSLSAIYEIRSYYVAWAYDPSVISSYSDKLK